MILEDVKKCLTVQILNFYKSPSQSVGLSFSSFDFMSTFPPEIVIKVSLMISCLAYTIAFHIHNRISILMYHE